MRCDLLIKNGTLMTPWGKQEGAIAIASGRVVAIGNLPGGWLAEQTLDAKGLHVLPGVIDSQVHFREPGLEHKEDLYTGTLGAVAGGVTTVFEMPNTNPSTSTVEAFSDKMRRANGRCWTNYAFYAGVTDDNPPLLAELEQLPGCCGLKLFMGSSTGSLLVPTDKGLRLAMQNSKRRMAIHAEDNERLNERVHLAKEGEGNPALHPVWRDEETALRATQRLLAIAEETRHPVHVLHVTTAEEMELLGRHKHIATVEVLPQHLTLSAPECYERLGTLAQMNPPIRAKRHQEALWQAINSGLVDVLGSDHAPHTLEEKARPYPKSPAGMTGVQTILPLMLNHVAEGRLPLERVVDLLCHGPARVFGMVNKGRLTLGADADITLVDMKAQRTISNDWIKSKAGWTPFDGMRISGWPIATIINGSIVMRDDAILGEPVGKPVAFWDTLTQSQRESALAG